MSGPNGCTDAGIAAMTDPQVLQGIGSVLVINMVMVFRNRTVLLFKV